MGKIAFLFPGQGAQVAHMGQDFYEQFNESNQVYELASEASGLDVCKLCFTENDELNITEFTQTALLATEIAILKVVLAKGVKPDYAAGLSLGEYGAVSTAGAIDDRDLFALIRKRGIYMQEAYPEGGAMMAVLGLDADTISDICKKTEGIVSIANDNCPGQIVITGEEKAVLAAGETLAAAGAKRCIQLNVSGPFHSVLLQGAADKLNVELADVAIHDIKIPYLSNVTADVVTDSSQIKDLLSKQVCSGVRFRESILKLKNLGVDTFVEIGPGKTLAGFVKKTDKELRVINIATVDDLSKLDEIV